MATEGGRRKGGTDRSQCPCWGRKRHPGRLVIPPRGAASGTPSPGPPRRPGQREGSFSALPLPFPVPPPRCLGVSGYPHPPLPRACARCVSPTSSLRLSSTLLRWRVRARCLMPARSLCLFTCRSISPQCPSPAHLSCVSWGCVAVSYRFSPTLSPVSLTLPSVSPSQSLASTCAQSFSVSRSLSNLSVSLSLPSVPPGLSQFLGLSPAPRDPRPATLSPAHFPCSCVRTSLSVSLRLFPGLVPVSPCVSG